jgi:DNA repair exonuclease SbcCD ATPase subunit
VQPPPGFYSKPPEVSRLTWDEDSFAKTTRRLDYIEELSEDNERVIDDLKREVERYKHLSSDSAKELNKYKSIYRHLLAKKEQLQEARSEASVTDLFRLLNLDDSCADDCETCRKLQADNEQLQFTVARLSGENAQLLGNFNSLYHNFSKVMRDKQQLTRRLTGVSTDLEELRGSTTSLTSQHCELVALSVKADSAEQQLALMEVERKTASIGKAEMGAELVDVQGRLAVAETENKRLRSDIKVSAEELSRLKQELKEQGAVTKSLNDYINHRGVEFGRLNHETENRHREAMLSMEGQQATLSQENKELKESLRNCKAFIAENCSLEDQQVEKCGECREKDCRLQDLSLRLRELEGYLHATAAKSVHLKEVHALHVKCTHQLTKLTKAASCLQAALEAVRAISTSQANTDQAHKHLFLALEAMKQLPETVGLEATEIEVIRNLARAAQQVLEVKTSVTPATKELRSQVHKKIISIEMHLQDLSSNYEAGRFQQMKDAFLELPYLLKPLFDVLRENERGPAHLVQVAINALSSVDALQYEQRLTGLVIEDLKA